MPETEGRKTPNLTKKHRQLLRDIDGLIREMGLSPEQVLSDWAGDSEGITAHLTRIVEHLVRAEIIGQYTYMDELLAMELVRHMFRGSRIGPRSRPRRTFWNVLRELYLLQKLRVIQSYRHVAKSVTGIIGAVSELRNTAAHEFGLGFSRRRAVRYKGLSLFKAEGVERLQADVQVVETFLAPWLGKIVARLNRDAGA